MHSAFSRTSAVLILITRLYSREATKTILGQRISDCLTGTEENGRARRGRPGGFQAGSVQPEFAMAIHGWSEGRAAGPGKADDAGRVLQAGRRRGSRQDPQKTQQAGVVMAERYKRATDGLCNDNLGETVVLLSLLGVSLSGGS